MAINFEAANMAGYNNPKIEVFKATVDLATNEITDAPSKTEIISCLHRGSIPAILQTSPDGSDNSMVWITSWSSDVGGDTILFASITFIIMYNPESDTPIVAPAG